ncbi:RNA polymerase sigma-70 factor [Paracidovorax sp. MALMAid1276]|uniref:RNA polymerase sigma-70 factor n=1 Tax=Paracidovorax sp. MALMAid1276 TaxID=3411631 RepID=UPI003B9D5C8D
MTSTTPTDPFSALRPRLFGIAYRMLGVRADAEDVLQDAWLRWSRQDPTALQSAEAWLVTVVTRLSIDRLRALKAEREAYVGWWLPEPLVEALDERTPESTAELAGELSVAFLHVLERLGPEERAAFLLRQVFDYDYPDIAAQLGKTEAACRQMVHRASERVQQARTRFEVPQGVHHQLLQRFMQAAKSGDRVAIESLLSEDALLIGDGGGKVAAFPRPLLGRFRIAMLYWAQQRRLGEQLAYRMALINGKPGLLHYANGRLDSAQAFETDGAQIVAIYAVRNPDKLAGIPHTLD